MRQLLVDLPTDLTPFAPPGDTSHRLRRVLRLAEGTELLLCDGQGRTVRAVWAQGLLTPRPDTAVHSQLTQRPLTLAVGVLKGERMDWLVEKAAELGVQTLQPLLLQHCVVKLQGRDRLDKQQRWQGLADAALEQCGRRQRMVVAPPQTLSEWLPLHAPATLWLADEREGATSLQTAPLAPAGGASLLIGPEGGLSEDERGRLFGHGAVAVALSDAVLRAETAALAGAVIAAGRLNG